MPMKKEQARFSLALLMEPVCRGTDETGLQIIQAMHNGQVTLDSIAINN